MQSDHDFKKGTDSGNAEVENEVQRSIFDSSGSHLIDLYERAPIGIVECSLDGRYINVNEEYCRITGYKRQELLRLGIHDITYPADFAGETDLYKKLISGNLPFYNVEQRYVRRNRAIIWVGIIRSLVRDISGKPLYTIGVIADISHRKAAQEFLRKSEAALQQKNIELERRVQEGIADLQVANLALAEGQKSLHLLSQRLVEAKEEERRIIARELHDRVGQSLAALKMNLTIIGDELSTATQPETSGRLTDSIGLVAQVIDLVRNVMTDLRPAVLDDYSLEAALDELVAQFHSRYNLNIQYEKNNSSIPRLSPEIEITLMRVAQEALLNIERHAGTNQAVLILRREDDTIYLAIEDKGIGIKALQTAKRSGNHGMTIMRERVEAVGGNFNVTSAPGRVTKIEVRVPVPNRA